jgi:hypothetical protein
MRFVKSPAQPRLFALFPDRDHIVTSHISYQKLDGIGADIDHSPADR